MKTQNTFSDGINMDVNPLVAPKTVMSNCLNGTLITYNGNENVLQNDMGNGKVHYAYLPQGWVPVGMAEHGGIIYVAAYNPETKESQLGSFPSPQQRFENTKNGGKQFTLAPGKYKLFDDKDLELKPGNKLAIALEQCPYTIIEPNFNNDNLKHKRHWGIQLCLLTSNGVLTDITEYVKTLVTPKEAAIYDPNENYKNYFFVPATEDEDPNYLLRNLRIYSGTLVGVPYINVIENLASSMDVEILPGLDSNNKIKFKVKCHIVSSSQLYGYQQELGLKGISWSVRGGCLTHDDGGVELIPSEIINNLEDTQEYSIDLEFIINPDIAVNLNASSTDITITLTPAFNWGSNINTLQSELTYTQTFDATKIGTGIHKINYWRYYYTEDFTTLTWGMESYPALGEEIQNLTLQFVNYKGEDVLFEGEPFKLSLEHDYYNGEFTEVLDSSIFTDKLPYIAKLSWTVGDQEQADYRWIIPTPLYNTFYQIKRVNDFHKDWGVTEYGKEMQALNKITGNILKFANEPNEKVELYTPDIVPFYSTNPNIREINLTNTYTYTLNPKLTVTEALNNYPFTLSYSTATNLAYIHNNTTYRGFIKNELTSTIDINYVLEDNVRVTKLFENHQGDLFSYGSYLVVGVTRQEHSPDTNKVMCYGYHNGELVINPVAIETADANRTLTWRAENYWDVISNYLSQLQNISQRFILPIVFFCEDEYLDNASVRDEGDPDIRSLGLNFALKREGTWCLYWDREVWSTIGSGWVRYNGYDILSNFSLISQFKSKTPATVYESRLENTNKIHQYGFPFFRCAAQTFKNVRGYLIKDLSTATSQDEDVEFTFKVEANVDIDLTLEGQDYNTIIKQNLIDYFEKESKLYTGNVKNRVGYYKVVFGIELSYTNDTNSQISQEFTFTNIKPGTYEVQELIKSYNTYGIETLVKFVDVNGTNYYVPKELLDADTVYERLDNGSLVEKNNATVEKYGDFRYIVGDFLYDHRPCLLVAQVEEDYCGFELEKLPTFRGDLVFGSTTPSN